MLNTYFLLFYEFFKIGLLAIGGGYATIPFLMHLTTVYDWFNINQLTDMIAVSNLTPGPIGINMATYSGYVTKGVLGSVISTLSIILAPFLITLTTIFFLNKFKNSEFTKHLFKALRPASCALLTFVMIQLFEQNVFSINKIDIKALFILILLFIIYPFVKKRPSLIILIGGLFGVIFNIF